MASQTRHRFAAHEQTQGLGQQQGVLGAFQGNETLLDLGYAFGDRHKSHRAQFLGQRVGTQRVLASYHGVVKTAMKRKGLIVLCLGVVGLLLFVLQRGPHEGVTGIEPAATPVSEVAQPRSQRRTNHSSQPSGIREVVDRKSVSIDFWGKVVDEEGVPVAGATVEATVRQWTGTSLRVGSSFKRQAQITASDGSFRITGERGDVLAIKAIGKDGFEAERRALRAYGFNISTNVITSREAPVVFRMWRLDSVADLLTGDCVQKISSDGEWHGFDRRTGKFSKTNNMTELNVMFFRQENARRGGPFDWKFVMEVPGGGIAEANDINDSMYLAPEGVFSNRYEFSVYSSDAPWRNRVRRRFYVLTSDAKYGRIDMTAIPFYAAHSNAHIAMLYAINTNGSRILRTRGQDWK